VRSALVFAGGRASRLGGVNKALLEVGGVTIVGRIIEALEPLVGELIAVVNDDALAHLPELRLVRDPDPHAGVLPALLAGLRAARGNVCLAVACDMPFVSRPLFEHQLGLLSGCDLVLPTVGGHAEPMHAVYRTATCADAVAAALERGERRMVAFHRDVRVRELSESELRLVDPDLRAFLNVNTTQDLDRARALAGGR
jgi:molybdopterin-guanine dinucleotide biosynthesis protein A